MNDNKTKTQLYPDLSPTDRIPRIIQEFVFPSLEEKGFKILKSGLSIRRIVDTYQQEIWFSKSKWNVANEICAFTPHFSVKIKNYKKWHLREYGERPLNDFLEGHAANYIDGWNTDLFDCDEYDLSRDNNLQIIKLLNQNIVNCGIPFLEQFSNYKSAFEYLMKSERYYIAPKMIDLCFMQKDFVMAKEIVNSFRNYKQTGESDFMESTLKEMSQRESKLKHYLV